MNRRLSICCILVLATASVAPSADPIKVRTDDLIPLLDSLRPVAAAGAVAAAPAQRLTERPTMTRAAAGHLESLSAPPGAAFPSPAGPAGQPELQAYSFITQNAALFGVTSPSVDFQLRKKNSTRGRHSVRMKQLYAGIPVFGGEVVVQVNDTGGVEYVSGNFERDTSDLDDKWLAIKPKLTPAEATAVARALYAPKAPGQALTLTAPELILFVPSLLKMNGPKRLTWMMEVWSADRETVGKQVFIDAHSGGFVQEIALIHEARYREVSDAAFTNTQAGIVVVRSEGGAPSAIADANLAYDFMGDTYNFYFSHFGRDGIANDGAPVKGTVRYREDISQPYRNGMWNGERMVCGEGQLTDDFVGHELTHGVTQSESGLIYLNESGAINESISDVFGEMVDFYNGGGEWLLFEDSLDGGTYRSMSNPPDYGQPDWRGSSLYYGGSGDSGGVHTNSGIGNKLCYLLGHGDVFRGLTVTAMGVDPTAALFYEANVNLLTPSSGWTDIANALKRAAVNLGWNTTQRNNLDTALQAVGIGLGIPLYYVDENSSFACTETGDSYCSFPFVGGPFRSLSSALTAAPAPTTIRLRGTGHTYRLDRPVRIEAWDGAASLTAP